MTENTKTNWPGVRETSDGKFSYSINVCNTFFIQSGFYDAEMAAQALDITKYTLVQSGHMRRSNYFFFPDEVAKWDTGVEFCPGPNEELRRFMAANQPRYAALKDRAENVPLPTPVKLFSAQQTIGKLLAATPSRLTVEEKLACNSVLIILANLIKP